MLAHLSGEKIQKKPYLMEAVVDFPPFFSLLTAMCLALSFWDLKGALPAGANST